MQLISFPFRLGADGTVVTVGQGSDEANAELIAVLCTTVAGERVFYPTFGLSDPVGGQGIAPSEIAAKVAQYGPTTTVVTDVAWSTEHTQAVTITFQ